MYSDPRYSTKNTNKTYFIILVLYHTELLRYWHTVRERIYRYMIFYSSKGIICLNAFLCCIIIHCSCIFMNYSLLGFNVTYIQLHMHRLCIDFNFKN